MLISLWFYGILGKHDNVNVSHYYCCFIWYFYQRKQMYILILSLKMIRAALCVLSVHFLYNINMDNFASFPLSYFIKFWSNSILLLKIDFDTVTMNVYNLKEKVSSYIFSTWDINFKKCVYIYLQRLWRK